MHWSNSLPLNDADSDIQNYALQQLSFFPTLHDLPRRIEPTLDPDRDEDVRFAGLDVLEKQLQNPAAAAILASLKDDATLGKHAARILGR